MPLSATATTSSGMWGARRSAVSSEHGEGLEIAVVDAHEAGAAGERRVELRFVVDLHQGIEPGLEGRVEELAQVLLAESGHDQEDRVGPGDPGLPDLIGVDQEVLAQGGQPGGGPGLAQVAYVPAEEVLLGENGECYRPRRPRRLARPPEG